MPTHDLMQRVAAGSTTFLVRRADALLYGAVVLVLVAPFFVFDTIPLYDLPDHIARQHLLFGDAAPGMESYYEAHWRLIPNLALEGAVFLLHGLLSIDLSIRIFLALTVGQLFLGTLALHHALFGRCGRLPLAAALFAYTGPLLFGFVNFCFGLGWVLWVFALWLRWRQRAVAIPILGLLAAVALLAHLFAFCIYALLVVSCWAGIAASRRRRELSPRALVASGRDLLHLAVPAALYLFAMPHESAAFVPFDADGWQEKVAALGSLLGFSDPIFDGLCLFAVAAGAILIAPRVGIAAQMRWPLACLTIAFLALPHRLGQGTFVDYRLPPCIMLLLIASTAWRDPADPWRNRVTVLVCGLLALRLGFLYPQWAAMAARLCRVPDRIRVAAPRRQAAAARGGAGPDQSLRPSAARPCGGHGGDAAGRLDTHAVCRQRSSDIELQAGFRQPEHVHADGRGCRQLRFRAGAPSGTVRSGPAAALSHDCARPHFHLGSPAATRRVGQ